MSDHDDSEFYIGYRKQAPAGVARFVRRRTLALYLFAAVLAVALILAQDRFAVAFFEFGNHRVFEGHIAEFPYPTLLVQRPSASGSEVPFSRYLLSVPGKHGAQQATAGLDGKQVRLKGTLIYRDDQTMIEIVPDTIEPTGAAPQGSRLPADGSVGRFSLSGEIVDSKCYLGVMKPGNLKPHRACAIRCISGGIPPVFIVRDGEGRAMHFLMVGGDGRTLNKEVLDFVADPIELEGEVVRDGGLLLLRTEPASFRRRY